MAGYNPCHYCGTKTMRTVIRKKVAICINCKRTRKINNWGHHMRRRGLPIIGNGGSSSPK